MLATHLDGMSSDEETSDRYQELFQTELGWLNICFVFPKSNFLFFKEQLIKEGSEIMDDVTDEFSKIEIILTKFYAWRKTDMASYRDAFVSLCLPKVKYYKLKIPTEQLN